MGMPNIQIDLAKLTTNLNVLKSHFAAHDVDMSVVTKCFCADETILSTLAKSPGIRFADSRMINLKKMTGSHERMLLRLPSIHQIDEVIRYSDVSLNSEMETIRAIDRRAGSHNMTHRIILMFDLGDLREGIHYRNLVLADIREIERMENVHLEGIGTNLTCYGGLIPTPDVYQRLKEIKDQIEGAIQRPLTCISGGNSSSVDLLMNGELPPFVNHLRIGEALLLGRETAYGKEIRGMHDDVFVLEADIIEYKRKPSKPEGMTGMDAFGNRPTFIDRGPMNRAILAIGRQDVSHHDLILAEGFEIIGSSSDHLIVNVGENPVKIGDTLRFKLTYGGILSLMTSPYVEKNYV